MEIFKIIKLLVNLGYYGGCVGFRWNNAESKLEAVRSKWNLWIGYFTVVLVSSFTFALGFCLLSDLSSGRNNFQEPLTCYRTVVFLGLLLASTFLLHSALRPFEVLEFTNNIIQYIKYCIGKRYIRSALDKKTFEIMVLGIGLGTVLIIGFVLIYFVDCQYHILSRILPSVCSESSSFYKLLYAIIIFFIISYGMIAALFYGAITFLTAFSAQDFLDILETSIARESMASKEELRSYLSRFRELQIISNRANVCFGAYILPYSLFIICTLITFLNYTFIKLKAVIFLHMFAQLANIGFVVFLALALHNAIRLPNSTQRIRSLILRRVTARSPYITRVLKSYHNICIKVGNFAEIEESTPIQMLSAIVAYTINFMVSF